MTFPIEPHTIFLALAGSQAHGTAREGSDVDVRGVCIAPSRVRLSLFDHFEQHEGPLPEALEPALRAHLEGRPAARALDVKSECVIFDVAKFVGLCAQANPNTLEILFADERDWVRDSPAWWLLHRERARFLTKKVQQTFHGYAMAQLRKIETHRAWLLRPPTEKPTREHFGLPATGTLSRDDQNRIEQAIAAVLRGFSVDDVEMPKASRIAVNERMHALAASVLGADEDAIEARTRAVATHALGLPEGVVQTLNAEKRYRAALGHWDAFQAWQRHRNPARAALEREHGYDTKHAMHLIRLMRMGIEVLSLGELRVRRADADELAAIRDGALPFEALIAMARALEASMREAAAGTTLPDDVDHGAIDALLLAVLEAG